MEKENLEARIVEPIEFEVGDGLHLRWVEFRNSNSSVIVQDVNNPEFFQGALLAIVVDDGTLRIQGTAFIVAPGLAITAFHILEAELNALQNSKRRVFCCGIRDGQAAIWDIRKINHAEDSDIAFLSIVLRTEIHEDRTLFQFPLTTRAPKMEEQIHIIGFTDGSVEGSPYDGIHAKMLSAVGEVRNVFPKQRDSVMLRFPTIEIQCGSVGGMSGGVVIDNSGHVCGVVCTGLSTNDKSGPTYASWIVGALGREVEIVWPRGLLKSPRRLIEIEGLTEIQGREKFKLDGKNCEVEIWFE